MANREMFKRILEQIEHNPKSFRMAEWEETFEEDDRYEISVYFPEKGESELLSSSECGTTRCVAGWAVFFDAIDKGVDVNKRSLYRISAEANGVDGDIDYLDYEALGAKILDIDHDVAIRLFYSDNKTAYNVVKEYAEGERG